jgi:hypothetical protein
MLGVAENVLNLRMPAFLKLAHQLVKLNLWPTAPKEIYNRLPDGNMT